MCKVMMMSGIKSSNVDNAIKFTKLMAKEISTGNADGLGYAAVNEYGDLFGERWLKNSEAFISKSKEELALELMFGDSLVDNVAEYNSFGDVDLASMTAITLHARYATSAKGFKNVHPFIKNDTSVIHNGVIRNVSSFALEQSTCDSECILLSYTNNEVGINKKDIQDTALDLVGYYVAGVFSRDKDGNRILDVFKAHNSNLVVSYVTELDCYVMTTSEYDIAKVCKELNFSYTTPKRMADGWLLRFDPVTGTIIDREEFRIGEEFDHSKSKSWTPSTYTAPTYNKPAVSTPTMFSGGTKKQKGGMTKSMYDYMKLTPSIQKLSAGDVIDLTMGSGGYSE